MTKGEIRDAVRIWLLNRPEATPGLIDSTMHKVYISMAAPFRFHEVEVETLINTVSGTRKYPLTSAQIYALQYAYDLYYGRELEIVDVNRLDKQIDLDFEGQPRKIARYGSNVVLDTSPDYTETGAIVLRGINLPAALTDDNDSPVYPEDWHFFIELQTASICSFMLGMEERGQLLQNMALGQLAGRQESHTIEAFAKQMGIIAKIRRQSNRNVEIR